jgi:hypothetical protein
MLRAQVLFLQLRMCMSSELTTGRILIAQGAMSGLSAEVASELQVMCCACV